MFFYSEHGEDRWLFEHDLIPSTGTYVDIGAAWPKEYSNTAMLRELGWEGVQVDGCEVFKPLWDILGLKLVVAVISQLPEVSYSINAEKPNLSRIGDHGNQVRAKTINQLLYEEGVGLVDLLSVDVEGSEFEVVSGLDFDLHRPRIIIWEYNTLGVKNERLSPFLEGLGYRCVHKTECNYIHVSV